MLCAILSILLTMLFSAAAFGEARQFTVYWPHDLAEAVPEWMGPPVEEKAATLGTVHIPIRPETSGDLAVTVYFVEPEDGFLRLFWVTSEEEVMLSPNLYEGVGAAHQRTILVPRALLRRDGVLTLQGSTTDITVYAVRFEWLSGQSLLASEAPRQILQLSTGQRLESREVSGVAYLPPAEGWSGDVVTVPLSERVEALEEGAEFVFDLKEAPSQARFSARLANADLSQPILVWVNGSYAGFLNLEVPTLEDEGYFENENAGHQYAGWRSGAVFLPGNIFAKGENYIQVSFAVVPQKWPVAKDLMLQLRYPDTPAPEGKKLGTAPDFMALEETAPRPQFRFE